MVSTGVITPAQRTVGLLNWLLNLKFLLWFFVIIAVYTISVAIQEKDIGVAVEGLGTRMYLPLVELQTFSQEIIDKNSFYDETLDTTPKKIWSYFTNFMGLISLVYIILIWLAVMNKIFSSISSVSPLFDYMISLLFFILVQIIFLLAFTPESLATYEKGDLIMLPLKALWSFVLVLPIILQPIVKMIDKLMS